MKKYRLIIQPPALDDLDEAYQWIREQAPEAAARWFNGFVEALNTLATFPDRCGLAPENDAVEAAIRQLLYGRRSGVFLRQCMVNALPLGDEFGNRHSGPE